MKYMYTMSALVVIGASADIGDVLHQAAHGAARTTEGAVDIATSPLPRDGEGRIIRRRQYVNAQGELVDEPIIYEEEVISDRPYFGERLHEGVEETVEGAAEVATAPLALFD